MHKSTIDTESRCDNSAVNKRALEEEAFSAIESSACLINIKTSGKLGRERGSRSLEFYECAYYAGGPTFGPLFE